VLARQVEVEKKAAESMKAVAARAYVEARGARLLLSPAARPVA
jgi:hypothetical protein